MLLAGITFAVLIAVYFLLDWGSRHIASQGGQNNQEDQYPMKINPEVAKALKEGRPVVALESTIISHGMPYPKNVETAYWWRRPFVRMALSPRRWASSLANRLSV
jgi:hypothetical protein